MKTQRFVFIKSRHFLFSLLAIVFCSGLYSQQTKITDFVIFGGKTAAGQTTPLAPGYAAQVGPSCNIQGGIIGSYNLVKSTGNLTIGSVQKPTNIFSGSLIQLANSNTVNGRLAAGTTTTAVTGTVISVGSSVVISGNVDANGNISIGGGSVSGKVTHPAGTTYSGPSPAGGEIVGPPSLPVLPTMPGITSFSAAGATNISNTQTITPGAYGDVTLGGNKTLTLKGPGVYIFKSIKNSGTSNNFVFDFNNKPGSIRVYVHNNVDLGKIKASTSNPGTGAESRIYLETHGKGTAADPVAFRIANGSAGNASKWVGTVWAPYAAANVGSGTGSTNLTGALWSGTQVIMQSGISMVFAPFDFCGDVTADAGVDKALNFNGIATLTGSSAASGVNYQWQASNGGIISTPANQQQITVSSAGTYNLTVSSNSGCVATDEVVVSGKLKNIIGSELQSIFENRTSDTTFFDIVDGYVKIDIIANEGKRSQVIAALLESLNAGKPGLKDTLPNGFSLLTITGRFIIDSIPKLNAMGNLINFCRPYYKAILFSAGGDIVIEDTSKVGLVRSEGDIMMKTHLVRKGYELYGDGLKIGVLSDSYDSKISGTTATPPFQPTKIAPYIISPITGDTIGTVNPIAQTFNTNTAPVDILNRDIPATIHNLPVFPPVSGTDEGRAMLQIVHDIAPGAELYFRSGFHTAGHFAAGIKELKDSGCIVIVDDITYPTEPFLRDGIIAKTVNEVKAAGVTYFSSAGNFADRSYEKEFNPVVFNGKTVHKFGTNNGTDDVFQKLKLAPGDYTFVFQWVDNIYSLSETNGTQNDFDIYLTKNEDGTGLIGFNRDNLVGDPIEFIPITVPQGDPVEYNVFIVNNTPNLTTPRLKYIVFRGNPLFLEYHEGTSTLVGQANAEGAIAVGASRFNHTPGHPLLPEKLKNITSPQIESFSSHGGTWVNGVQRQKPELTGPDGVNTTVKMGQDYPDWSLDGFSNFFGTSAGAPHAAAAAALLIQGRKKFLNQPTTPDQIKALMQTTAVDMATPGFDFISGAGLVDADAAMRSFAAPRPHSIKLVVPDNVIPGDEEFELLVTGENFSLNTEVWYNNIKLDPIRVSATLDSIWVLIPPFTGNPEIRAFTPPKPGTNGNDGGYSNSLYFFDADIVITAQNKSIKYGQQLPALETLITINGIPLEDTTLTLADLGLENMIVTTTAPANGNVGTYTIAPSFDPNEMPHDSFFVKYNYEFINAQLSIGKMPLKVTPNDKTIIYGQHLGKVTFKYEFDPAYPPADPAALRDSIKLYHEAILPNNALAVVKDFNKVQAGGSPLSFADLANMNMLVTYKAMNNSRKFKLENGRLVPTADLSTLNIHYLVDIASESIYNYKLNPASAPLVSAYQGSSAKALLGATALSNNTATVQIPSGLASMINGRFAQTVNTAGGPAVPIVNNTMIQILNGKFAQYVNGNWEPVPNSGPVDLINNKLASLINGVPQYLAEGETVQLFNGTLIQVNAAFGGGLAQIVNAQGGGGGGLAQIVNSSDPNLVIINGVGGSLGLALMVNGVPQELANGTLVMFPNAAGGGLAQYVNGVGGSGGLAQIVNGQGGGLAQIVNAQGGGLAQIVNGVGGSLGLAQYVNGEVIGVGTANNNTAVIIDESNVGDPQTGNWLGAMWSINMITGLDAGVQKLISGNLPNPNFEITYDAGTVTIEKAPLTITAENKTKQYGDPNPELTVTYSGFENGETFETSGISGAPAITTTVTPTTPAGVYPNSIIVQRGTLASNNYAFQFVNGTFTVTNNPCLLTRNPFNNFGSTPSPQSPTSLWVNVAVKVSGQLVNHGDSLLFTGGTITLNDIIANDPITNAAITTKDLQKGKVIADASVTVPITHFDAASQTWITRIPPGFSSTSDIFVSGTIINSSTGFVNKKKNANSNTVVNGIFYTNVNYSDQWTYALATYRPVFTYSTVGGSGQVVAINGAYRAGTPTPVIQYLVNGGSGGGGNNYTGSTSSFDNFTACCLTCTQNQLTRSSKNINTVQENSAALIAGDVKMFPNPVNDMFRLLFVPAQTGHAKIALYTMDGRKVYEKNYGTAEADRTYTDEIDVKKLTSGIYLVQLTIADKLTSKKIIVRH